jgi:hypothetical protein
MQEDWQLTRRLTVNIGMRWEYESPVVERYNRQNRGFDFTSPSGITAGSLDVRGGLLFPGMNGQPRGAFKQDFDSFQPRFGFAWRAFPSRPLVFRGGVGRSYLPTVDFGGNTGFSQTTNAETSDVEGRSIRLLSNPFPSGLLPPPGASRGLATQAGDNISFIDIGRTVPYVWQYSFGFQYEVFKGVLLEALYSGSQTHHLQVSKNINALTIEQLALGTAYLNAGLSNPFYGVLPASTPRGSVTSVQRRVLLLPYPQFGTITMGGMSIGHSWYNSVQLRLEKRFRQGVYLLATYTNSKNMEAVAYLNAQDKQLSRELASYDIPQRVVLAGIYALPFGKRKRWVQSGAPAKVIGGWELAWNGTAQSGTPLSLPDYYINGNPQLPASQQTLNRWFDTSPQLWSIRPPDTLRTAKLRSPNIRRDSEPQFNGSLIRTFAVTERQRFQLKLSVFNLTNTPVFGFPNNNPASPLFGVVPITQINLPRAAEIGLRYSF